MLDPYPRPRLRDGARGLRTGTINNRICLWHVPCLLLSVIIFAFQAQTVAFAPDLEGDEGIQSRAVIDGTNGESIDGNDILHDQSYGESLSPPKVLTLSEDNFSRTFRDLFVQKRNMSKAHTILSDLKVCILVIHSPECPNCLNLLEIVKEASVMIANDYDTISSSRMSSIGFDSLPSPPILGIMDGTNLTRDFRAKFEPIVGYPSSKLVLARFMPQKEEGANTSLLQDEFGPTVVDVFDYLGPIHSARNMVQTIWHYWYRFVATREMFERAIQTASSNYPVDAIDPAPVFVLPGQSAVMRFLQDHGDAILAPSEIHVPSQLDKNERKYVESLLVGGGDANHIPTDPLIVFVQCQHGGNGKDSRKFNVIAEELVNRRDVVFFSLRSEERGFSCSNEQGWFDFENNIDGAVRVMKVGLGRTQNVKQALTEAFEDKNFSHGSDTYIPGREESLLQFIICHTTPTVLWFDRELVAAYAFPQYRQIHAVLFVDTPRFDPDGVSPKESDPIVVKSRKAIKQFRNAAVRHRRDRPKDDIVFLIVPSYEIRVLSIFGIDIWSGLDTQILDFDASQETPVEELLPTVMLTSRYNPNGGGKMNLKRYYLPSKTLLKDIEGGNQSDGGVISRFIDDFFENKAQPDVLSQSMPNNSTNGSGVQILTGSNFQSVALDQADKHGLVYFFAPTCGHCKRFNVIWNQLSLHIKALNWENTIQIMKMDLTKNELPLDGLEVYEYPSVYYFPANDKHNPIPMLVKGSPIAKLGDANANVVDLIEWLLKQGKFNKTELVNLHADAFRVQTCATSGLCGEEEEAAGDV